MRKNLDLTGLSARNRRLLAFGVSGGDESADDLALILERITVETLVELTDEDVAAQRTLLTDRIAAMPADPKEWTDADLADAVKIEAALGLITADETRRETEATERTTAATELLARIRGDASDGDGGEGGEGDAGEGDQGAEGAEGDAGAGEGAEGAEGEGEAGEGDQGGEGEPEAPSAEAPPAAVPIAASAKPARRVEARGNPTKPIKRGEQKVDERLVLRASANVPGSAPGEHLDNPKKLATAFLRAIQASQGYHGPRVEIPIASLGAFDAIEVYGEDRTLDDHARGNMQKIEAVVGRSALRASGGICAPPPVLYTQPVLGTDARPVKASMVAAFGADRGGVRTLPPPHLADVTGAITVWTEANDVDPSDPATKACLTLTCPEEEETLVDAIVKCLKIGNYRARNFPEQITAWMSKVVQQAAKVAETKMLTEIGAGSTQVAVPHVLGTARDVLTTIDRASSQIRNRHRLDPDFPLRFGAPAWLLDNMITDLAREHPGATAERLATSDADLNRFIAARNVNATWFLDGESGQVYGAQSDGDLLAWFSHVVCYLYPEGQWLGLDGGSLDFGIVRDSILNATNDFIMMSEFFEKTHEIRLADSYRIDLDICANGQTSEGVAISVCNSGS